MQFLILQDFYKKNEIIIMDPLETSEYIGYLQHDKRILPTMLKSSIENLKHKIEMEASNISGELLAYSEDDVKKMILELLIKY